MLSLLFVISSAVETKTICFSKKNDDFCKNVATRYLTSQFDQFLKDDFSSETSVNLMIGDDMKYNGQELLISLKHFSTFKKLTIYITGNDKLPQFYLDMGSSSMISDADHISFVKVTLNPRGNDVSYAFSSVKMVQTAVSTSDTNITLNCDTIEMDPFSSTSFQNLLTSQVIFYMDNKITIPKHSVSIMPIYRSLDFKVKKIDTDTKLAIKGNKLIFTNATEFTFVLPPSTRNNPSPTRTTIYHTNEDATLTISNLGYGLFDMLPPIFINHANKAMIKFADSFYPASPSQPIVNLFPLQPDQLVEVETSNFPVSFSTTKSVVISTSASSMNHNGIISGSDVTLTSTKSDINVNIDSLSIASDHPDLKCGSSVFNTRINHLSTSLDHMETPMNIDCKGKVSITRWPEARNEVHVKNLGLDPITSIHYNLNKSQTIIGETISYTKTPSLIRPVLLGDTPTLEEIEAHMGQVYPLLCSPTLDCSTLSLSFPSDEDHGFASGNHIFTPQCSANNGNTCLSMKLTKKPSETADKFCLTDDQTCPANYAKISSLDESLGYLSVGAQTVEYLIQTAPTSAIPNLPESVKNLIVSATSSQTIKIPNRYFQTLDSLSFTNCVIKAADESEDIPLTASLTLVTSSLTELTQYSIDFSYCPLFTADIETLKTLPPFIYPATLSLSSSKFTSLEFGEESITLSNPDDKHVIYFNGTNYLTLETSVSSLSLYSTSASSKVLVNLVLTEPGATLTIENDFPEKFNGLFMKHINGILKTKSKRVPIDAIGNIMVDLKSSLDDVTIQYPFCINTELYLDTPGKVTFLGGYAGLKSNITTNDRSNLIVKDFYFKNPGYIAKPIGQLTVLNKMTVLSDIDFEVGELILNKGVEAQFDFDIEKLPHNIINSNVVFEKLIVNYKNSKQIEEGFEYDLVCGKTMDCRKWNVISHNMSTKCVEKSDDMFCLVLYRNSEDHSENGGSPIFVISVSILVFIVVAAHLVLFFVWKKKSDLMSTIPSEYHALE